MSDRLQKGILPQCVNHMYVGGGGEENLSLRFNIVLNNLFLEEDH